jgi:predicted transcriptional regulator
MFKDSYHPKAFLSNTKNVKQGLITRTKIASILDKGSSTVKTIKEKTSINYSSILHHLHLMENEYIVKKNNKRPFIWELTGVGQKKLTEL